MIKVLNKLGIEKTHLNIIKTTYDKSTANIISVVKSTSPFLLRSGRRQGCSLTHFFLAVPCGSGTLVSQPGIEPVSPTVEVQSSNLWTSREFPSMYNYHMPPGRMWWEATSPLCYCSPKPRTSAELWETLTNVNWGMFCKTSWPYSEMSGSWKTCKDGETDIGERRLSWLNAVSYLEFDIGTEKEALIKN